MSEKKKQKRFYYIQYCPYGVRISPDSLNGNAFSYYAFASYTARKKWLDENDMDGVNWVAATITRTELVERIGKRFVITTDYGIYGDDDTIIAYEVLPANHEKAAYCMAVYSTYWPLF